MVLVSNPIGTSAQLPNGLCSAEDLACHLQDDNLVGIVEGVANLGECLENQNEADFVTYFGQSGFPFINTCLFYSACDSLDPCDDCLTLDLTSTCISTNCSAPIEGTLGSNLISVVDDISDRETCDKLC